MDQHKYNVFISYSTKDYIDGNKNVIPDNVISKVKTALGEAGITYWFDEEGIYSGDEFAPILARAIRESEIFLFISSRSSNESEWTSSEIATAHTYRKKIIPFRIDESVYHESVIMFVARLNTIDYFINPDKAIDRLVESIQDYLIVKRAEQERIRREKEEREEQLRLRFEREQKDLAVNIELGASELDTDEAKVDIRRKRLLADVQKIEDLEIRGRLGGLIEEAGPIYRRNKEERKRLNAEVEKLTSEVATLSGEITSLKDEAQQRLEAHANERRTKIYKLIRDKKLYLALGGAFVLFILILSIGISNCRLKLELDNVREQAKAELQSKDKQLKDMTVVQDSLSKMLDLSKELLYHAVDYKYDSYDNEVRVRAHFSEEDHGYSKEDFKVIVLNEIGERKYSGNLNNGREYVYLWLRLDRLGYGKSHIEVYYKDLKISSAIVEIRGKGDVSIAQKATVKKNE